jgi:hypothetical protein
MRSFVLAALFAAHVAHADSSVPQSGGAPLRCKTQWRNETLDKKAIDRQFGAGVSRVAETLVKDERGRVVGVLGWHRHAGSGLCFYDAPKPRWCLPRRVPDDWASAIAISVGGTVIVSTYMFGDTYVDLKAYELDRGVPLWSAEVMQIRTLHSKYWNQPELSLDGANVVLTDYQAVGCFRQTVDAVTGRVLSSQRGSL